MRIEPITPIISKYPKSYKQSDENPLCVDVTEYDEHQTGWEFGEEKDVIGKLNKIINWINSKDDQLL